MTNYLSDIITYVRRIVKTPSDAVITDNLIIDYINRFWIMDVDARIQLFDLKTTYQFQTTPGIDKYNMPLYTVQSQTGGAPESEDIALYPVYQNMINGVFINGIEMPLYTERDQFYRVWPNYNQALLQAGTGDGSSGPYTLSLPFIQNSGNVATQINSGIIRGHVDMTGIIDTGTNQDPPLSLDGSYIQNSNINVDVIRSTSIYPGVYFTSVAADGSLIQICDSGVFLTSNQNYGLLMEPGPAPYGNQTLPNEYVSSFAITGATQADPCVLTATTTLTVGQTVLISGVNGMIELNGNTYTVTAVDATTVTIDVNSTNFTAYSAPNTGTVSSLTNLINYQTGVASNIFFPKPIPDGTPIQAQCVYYQTGIPRAVLFHNNVLTFRAPPNTSYLVEVGAYLTPAAFFSSSQMVPFAYMSEYIARGAARKILSDIGDVEQFNFYEPLFKEQESLVWKRSQRQFTATRTPTIYSQVGFPNTYNQGSFGV